MDNAHRVAKFACGQSFDLAARPLKAPQYVPGYQSASGLDAKQDCFGAKYEEQMVGRFGLGCLSRGGLAEVGARYIEVTTEYNPGRSSTGQRTRTGTSAPQR